MSEQAPTEAFIPASEKLPEITVKAVVLSIFLTIILAAANAYLGLKVGMTISASIPAAVISMAVLGMFKQSNVLENNIVQTAASCGEAITGIVAFTLPALLVIGYWNNFAYWPTMLIAGLGGTLGVLLSVPLRKVLLNDKRLTFPEGTAIGNVLKARAMQSVGSKQLFWGGGIGALMSLSQSGFKILTDGIQYWVRAGGTVFGGGIGFAPALIGAGYIIGINVTCAILLGVIIGWGISVPLVGHIYGLPTIRYGGASQMAYLIWNDHVRYIGLGVLMIGGLRVIFTLVKPVYFGVQASMESLKVARLNRPPIPRTERDVPLSLVFWCSIFLLFPIYLLLTHLIDNNVLQLGIGMENTLEIVCLIMVVIGAIIFTSVCGYFAGLVGSSTSPVSSMSLISLILISLILSLLLSGVIDFEAEAARATVVAGVAIMVMAVIASAAVIGNDTLQDLKAGQMVGATPWKQQVMLILGVIIAAAVAPLILELLFNAYGIAGVFPRPGMDHSQMLAAPQAGLMAAVAQGIFSRHSRWGMMAIGGAIGIAVIIVEYFLIKKKGWRLSPVAVGMGMYLPTMATTSLFIGGVMSYLLNRMLRTRSEAAKEAVKHNGMLLACGLVAGAAVMGVLLAVPFVLFSDTDILRLLPERFSTVDDFLSIVVTVLVCVWFIRRALVSTDEA